MRTRIALATALAVVVTLSTAGAAAGARPPGSRSPVPSGAHRAALVSAGRRAADRGGAPAVTPQSLRASAVAAAERLPAPAPAVPLTDATSVWTRDWNCIRIHESGTWFNSPAAPSGAYGIVEVTWHSMGQSGWPYEAPAAVQNAVALALYHRYGFSPWSTRRVCGL